MTEWKLVPVRPTPEMVLAGVKGQSNRATVPRDDELATGHYYDMLAAAPEPPADERDAEIARLREALGRYGTHEYDDEGNPCRGGEFTRALDADGQPEFYDCTCGFNDALRGESGDE